MPEQASGKSPRGRALPVGPVASFHPSTQRVEIEDGGGAGLYADVLGGRRMCLCGMMAAEYQTLPDPMRDAVVTFLDHNEQWLERILERGRVEDGLRILGAAKDAAGSLLSGLGGAMPIARPYDDVGASAPPPRVCSPASRE